MSERLDAIVLQLRFLEWRDAQFAAIHEQLVNALPELIDQLDSEIRERSKAELLVASASLDRFCKKTFEHWQREQVAEAMARAELSFDETLEPHLSSSDLSMSSIEAIRASGMSLAGVGGIAASLGAIPAVVSFATPTASVLLYIPVATISWPIVAAGAVGLGAAAFAGGQLFDRGIERIKDSISKKVSDRYTQLVLGTGADATAQTFLSDMQAVVLGAGSKKLGAS